VRLPVGAAGTSAVAAAGAMATLAIAESYGEVVLTSIQQVRRRVQLKVDHRCQRHRRQICRRYQRHRWQICHRYQRHRQQILPPVSVVLLILVANLPLVSTIPAVNLELQIYARLLEKIRNGPNGILWGWGETDS
jgi:hypothetical protein